MGDNADDFLDDDIEDNRESNNEDLNDEHYMGGDMPMERHSDLLKDLTDFDNYIKEIINGWLGKYFNIQSGKWENNPNSKPIMNEQCAVWCVTFLKTYTRKNNIITHINKNNYINIMSDVIEVLWLNIGGREQEFEIKSTGDILRICTELEHAISLVLMGAGDGKYGDLLMGTYQQAERGVGNNQYPININNPAQKLGIIKRTKNWLVGGGM